MYRFIFLLFLFSNTLFSQNISVKYNDGLNCFLKQDYVCAKSHFSDIIIDYPNVSKSIIEYAIFKSLCFLNIVGRLVSK